MNHTCPIIKKELKNYFNSPLAYVFISIYLIITAWIFFTSFFLAGQLNMQQLFSIFPWVFLFLIPAITMRLLAEEKSSKQLNFCLPGRSRIMK